jgi:DNA-directed RNA polymerase I, II, and III subunit RPABC2|tara:strand:+ start:1891 stop:2229 length:339 start_codon:yes stop_codon:yes gene_type:complete
MQSLIPNKGIKVSSMNDTYEKLKENKISKAIMTKYEYNQIISQRATMLAQGAQSYVDIDFNINSNMDLRLVANKELLEGKLPFIIKRPLPNNKFDYYRIKDLDLIAIQHMIR